MNEQGMKRRRWVAVAVGVSVAGVMAPLPTAAGAQTLAGPFDTFNSWWLNPTSGLPGVIAGTQICIDLDGDGSQESCYSPPVVPVGTLTNLRLSPTRRILMAYGNTTNCGPSMQADTVYFFSVPDPPGALTLIDNECIPNGINSGQVGFYDTGLCCDGLADLSCPSFGLTCTDGGGSSLLGVSPQRIAYVADQGDWFGQLVNIYWFDLVGGTHATTFPGFNSQLPLTRLKVSPYGDVAFVQHDVGGGSDSDYSVIDLCAAPRLGDPLSSNVGGALFGLDLPSATAEMIDNGGGDYAIRIDHPDLPGGQLGLDFTPCSGNPTPLDGACCRADGCSVETADDCDTLLGNWLGPDTTCDECPITTLSVTVNGPGMVSSSPGGISCPSDCVEDYALGQVVDLTANPTGNAILMGWSGNCTGTDATVQVTMDADRNCTATFAVVADLEVQKTDDPDPVVAGTTLYYTITVTNHGPADATGVTLYDTLPPTLSYDALQSDPACDPSGSSVICALGTIVNGESRVVAVVVLVDPTARGNLNNAVSVSANELDTSTANNFDTAATTVQARADLSITKSALPPQVEAGGQVFYQIEVTNHGPSTATQVEVTDTLPNGVIAASGGDPTQLTCNGGGGNLGVEQSLTVGFTALVDGGLSDGTVLTNTATVTSAETDPNLANNVTSVDSTVAGTATFRAAPRFTRVADTDTPIPQGFGTFTDFGGGATPAVSDALVAFRGRGADQDGIYEWRQSTLGVVADIHTPIPGGTGNFGAPPTGGFYTPSVDGEDVAFNGDDQTISQRGVYTRVNGTLDVVADKTTVAPGAFTPFSTMALGGLDDGNISFWAFVPTAGALDGIYYGNTKGIVKVAGLSTLIPGGSGTFQGFTSNTYHKQGNVLFYGYDSGFNFGLYRWAAGVLSLVANQFTPIPGGIGTFTLFFQTLSFDGVNLAFRGDDAALTQFGIYMEDCGGLRAIVDSHTAVPCGSGNFTGLSGFATHQGNLAFVGYGDANSGLYAQLGGRTVKVLEVLDELDGKTVSAVRVGPEGLLGDRVAFVATFTDGSEGVYVAELTAGGVCHPFDADDDDDHDLFDMAAFSDCYTGARAVRAPDCAAFDADGDGHIDGDDLNELLARLAGPVAPPLMEACCQEDGSCTMADADTCTYVRHGTPQPGAICSDNPCVPAFGACCSFKGCFEASVEVCAGLEGTYFPGQACVDVVCE